MRCAPVWFRRDLGHFGNSALVPALRHLDRARTLTRFAAVRR